MNNVLLFTIDWLNRPLTDQLIASLYELDTTLLIIINDDMPADYAALPVNARLKLETLQMQQNIGFSQACNLAIDLAIERKLPFLMHLNNDVRVVDANQITYFINVFASYPQLAAASPAVSGDKGKVEFAGSSHLARISSAIIHSRQDMQLSETNMRESVFFDGACFIARTDALQQSGGFCPDYFAYREEHDLAYRLRHCGWRVAYINNLQVQHATSASAGRHPRFMAFLILRGQFIFMRRNLGALSAIWYSCILVTKVFIGIALKISQGDRQGLTGMRLALLNQLFGRVIYFNLHNNCLTFHKSKVELNGRPLSEWGVDGISCLDTR